LKKRNGKKKAAARNCFKKRTMGLAHGKNIKVSALYLGVRRGIGIRGKPRQESQKKKKENRGQKKESAITRVNTTQS
jgi:hypothetical protein